jgi:hypothetical protein
MKRVILWIGVFGVLGCRPSRHAPPEFLPGVAGIQTKSPNSSSNDYAGAAATLAGAVTSTAINREAFGTCYASCPTGMACNAATGMCEALPCGGKCPADYRCKLVEGRETCVREPPDRMTPSPAAEPEGEAPPQAKPERAGE